VVVIGLLLFPAIKSKIVASNFKQTDTVVSGNKITLQIGAMTCEDRALLIKSTLSNISFKDKKQ